MIMRVFLMIMIFAIGFSGYSATAHAFGHEYCDQAMMVQVDDHTGVHGNIDMSDCPGHQADQDQQKDADTDKADSKGKCMDCNDCCTSHAASLSDYSVGFSQPLSVLNPLPLNLSAGDFLFSLLRPPKSLV